MTAKITSSPFFHQACYINGTWIQAKQQVIDVHNPATGEKIGSVPQLSAAEAEAAIHAAHQALPQWRNLGNTQRSRLLMRWFELIREHEAELAQLMTLEQGKPVAEAKGEIRYAASFIQWYAEEAKRMYGETMPAANTQTQLLTIREPIGVCAAITPWNFPSAMITRKVAPALAAGCTYVIKPSTDTPFSALALAYLAEQAGIPAGVINIVTGDAKELGKLLSEHPLIRKLSFTGSTQVGSILMRQAASTIKKVSLELGGNAPFIVFDDADLEAAVDGLIASKFRNAGQTCVCANRIYVQRSVYERFTELFVQRASTLKAGDGFDPQHQIGPLIHEQAVQKVERHIEDAVQGGAYIVLGGKRLSGTFFEPTVLTNVSMNALCTQEETFGPIAPLIPFDTEEEVIAAANNTEYGLAAYFYSDNIHRIQRVSRAIESGMIGINTGMISNERAPFGGVKQSGIGREGSKHGLDEYTDIKYLCLGLQK